MTMFDIMIFKQNKIIFKTKRKLFNCLGGKNSSFNIFLVVLSVYDLKIIKIPHSLFNFKNKEEIEKDNKQYGKIFQAHRLEN